MRQNRRYARCFACTTGTAFARAVAQAGYATDPEYGDKIVSIIEQNRLDRLDGGA